MPQVWTDKKAVRISDQIPDEDLSLEDLDRICELALDYLNNPDSWLTLDHSNRCSFLGTHGYSITVSIGLATVVDIAVVYHCDAEGGRLSEVKMPLTRVDELEPDYVDEDYQSKPLVQRDVVEVRAGKTRRLRPLKFEPGQD